MACVNPSVVLLRSFARSTAHGISHAAMAKALPLRVMWCLLFVVSLVLFSYGAINIINRQLYQMPASTQEMDTASFIFPDLYFCPTIPFSGSFPYSLTAEEAGQLEYEKRSLLDRCRQFKRCRAWIEDNTRNAIDIIHFSLSVHLATKLLAKRKTQSILGAFLYPGRGFGRRITIEAFSHPENMICFRTVLTKNERQKLRSRSSELHIWLSTDPHFSKFLYSGHKIANIMTDSRNMSMDFLNFHPRMSLPLRASGYTVLFVPPGAYPSMEYEHSLQLAPGNAYRLKVSMTENTYSLNLRDTHCAWDHPHVAVRDPLSHERVEFNYSHAYCNYLEMHKQYQKRIKCLAWASPVPWELRHVPRCLNISEMTEDAMDAIYENNNKVALDEVDELAEETCLTRMPCQYLRYTSTFSFSKWPSDGTAAEDMTLIRAKFLPHLREKDAPALVRLLEIAKLLNEDAQSGSNRSEHLRDIFRSYASESLLTVIISSRSPMATKVTLAWPGSFVNFLAEIGGLLGLYIGCSVLTLFELIDLLWALFCVSCSSCQRQQRNSWDWELRGPDELVAEDETNGDERHPSIVPT